MPKHVMFDVDGTLVQSYEFDEALFVEAVLEVTGLEIDSNWQTYPHVTDWGLIRTFCQRQATQAEFEVWLPAIKDRFVAKVTDYLHKTPAQEIAGAASFFARLASSGEYCVSIATGGWGETARLKLESAGFDLSGIVLKSSNDHYQREQIMQLAASSENTHYFGDGEWDKVACKALGYNFIAVGERVQHHQHLDDFLDQELALNFLYDS